MEPEQSTTNNIIEEIFFALTFSRRSSLSIFRDPFLAAAALMVASMAISVVFPSGSLAVTYLPL
jgi:hypothetical protein